jgi:hypothetical protein
MLTFQTLLNLDPTQLTNGEKDIAIESFRKLILGQALHIQQLERENVDVINHSFQLAREVDELTEGVFRSPILHPKEHSV